MRLPPKFLESFFFGLLATFVIGLVAILISDFKKKDRRQAVYCQLNQNLDCDITQIEQNKFVIKCKNKDDGDKND